MKKIVFSLIVIAMIFISGCGNNETANEASYNQNEAVS